MPRIIETNDIWETAIEQALDYSDTLKLEIDPSLRGNILDRPILTLGKPNFWILDRSGPIANHTKVANSEFLLCRLAFSIRTLVNPVENVTLTINMKSPLGNPTAFDLYPRELISEDKSSIKLTISPEIKFVDIVNVSIAKIETTIDNVQVIPIIEAFGMGESQPQWVFKNHKKYPLRGIRIVYMIIEKPFNSKAVMNVIVQAQVKTREGIFRAKLDIQKESLSWLF